MIGNEEEIAVNRVGKESKLVFLPTRRIEMDWSAPTEYVGSFDIHKVEREWGARWDPGFRTGAIRGKQPFPDETQMRPTVGVHGGTHVNRLRRCKKNTCRRAATDGKTGEVNPAERREQAFTGRREIKRTGRRVVVESERPDTNFHPECFRQQIRSSATVAGHEQVTPPTPPTPGIKLTSCRTPVLAALVKTVILVPPPPAGTN